MKNNKIVCDRLIDSETGESLEVDLNHLQLPKILYRNSDGQPFYLWSDGMYYTLKEEDDDGHLHWGYRYDVLMSHKIFSEINYFDENKKREEEMEAENMPDPEDFNSLLNFLWKIQHAHISCRKGAEYLYDMADDYWFEGVKTGRGDKKYKLLKLSELEKLDKYEEFIKMVVNTENPDGTYNHCWEELKEKAKEILGE